MHDRIDLSRYWRWGAVEIELPRWSLPSVKFIRNGRMIGLSVSVGRLYFSPAIYRPPWGES